MILGQPFRLPTRLLRKRGSDEALLPSFSPSEVREGLNKHFKEVIEKKKYAPSDVAAGREYVEAYVTYIHYVERLHEAAEKPLNGHSSWANMRSKFDATGGGVFFGVACKVGTSSLPMAVRSTR